MKITITQQHLDLLKQAYISEYECEFGGWGLDCKRPFGNSDVIGDILEILGYIKSGLTIDDLPKELQDDVENRDIRYDFKSGEFEELDEVTEMLEEYYYEDLMKIYNELEHVITIIFQNPGVNILNETYYLVNRYDNKWEIS